MDLTTLTQRLRGVVRLATTGSIGVPASLDNAASRTTDGPTFRPSTRRQLTGERGAGGVSYISGILDSDEFNAKLTGTTGVETYDKMRRTDAQVAALINACTLPILGAKWDIDRPADEAEAERITDEHLAFARHNLFTRINFPAFLRHACSCLWAGYAWFEKVYAIEDEQLVLRRLSPRLASTLWRWWTDGAGELTGVQQKVWQNRTYQYLDYARDKIALFVYDQEANCFEGKSLLRAVYRPFTIKDVLYKLDAIRAERYAVGVPNVQLPRDFDKNLYEMAQEIGQHWKGAEQSYVISVEGMTVDILQVKGGEALDLLKSIQHHNEQIALVGLAQFLNYGTTQTGSRALGDSAQEFFYDAAQGWANALASALCREVLWPLMDYNYAGQVRPVVVVRDLGALSLGQLTDTLQKLGTTFLTPRLEVENAVLERLNLPPITVEQWEEKEAKAAAAREAERVQAPTVTREPAERRTESQDDEPEDVEPVEHTHTDAEHLTVGTAFWRPLRPTEEHVGWRLIDGMLDDSRDRIVTALKTARDSWLPVLQEQILQAWPRGPRGIEQAEIPDRLLVPLRAELLEIQGRLFRFGQEQVAEELRRQARAQGRKLPSVPAQSLFRDTAMDVNEMADLVEARTDILTTRLQRTTQEAAWQIALGYYRTRGPDDLTPEDVDQMFEEIFERAEQESRLVASMSVAETLNLGREVGFDAFADQIAYVEYSAIMDGPRTCKNCASMDGKRVQLNSPDYFAYQPPLKAPGKRCLGGSRCRCLWVAVMSDETNAAV